MDARLYDYSIGRGHATVEGWLGEGALATAIAISQQQKANGTVGHLAEIGVHHGRLFLVLALLRALDEVALAIDVFEDQHLNIDWSGSGDRSRFETNMHRHAGGVHDVRILKADSLTLTAADLVRAMPAGDIRMFSVDGGHTVRHVLNDLALASGTLARDGIVIVDDYYNPDWPGVNEGVARFLNNEVAFAPFGYGDNKLYLCRRDAHARWLAWYEQRIVPHAQHAKRVELAGHAAFHAAPTSTQALLDARVIA
jgi:hypothetical protein